MILDQLELVNFYQKIQNKLVYDLWILCSWDIGSEVNATDTIKYAYDNNSIEPLYINALTTLHLTATTKYSLKKKADMRDYSNILLIKTNNLMGGGVVDKYFLWKKIT